MLGIRVNGGFAMFIRPFCAVGDSSTASGLPKSACSVWRSPPCCTGLAADSWGTASRRIFIICAGSGDASLRRDAAGGDFQGQHHGDRMILDRNFEPKPQLVHFESGLVELRHRVGAGRFHHADAGHDHLPARGRPLSGALSGRGDGGRLDNGVFVERLSEMEKKQKFMADSVTGEAEPDGEKPEQIRAALRGGARRTEPAGSGEGGRA